MFSLKWEINENFIGSEITQNIIKVNPLKLLILGINTIL